MTGQRYIEVLSDCIVSPLGISSEENFNNVISGVSGIERHDGVFGLPTPFMASLLNRDSLEKEFRKEKISQSYTFFEKCMILSSKKAIAASGIDPSSDRVVFVISSTKGNVELLSEEDHSGESLHSSALALSRYFNNPNIPIIVSNACISGVCALIAAKRALSSGRYDYAVVTGADCQSHFIVSGFQSFKALSDECCRPFDAQRKGLNLGEASATIILAASRTQTSGRWTLGEGAVRNDANHISGPSRTGEGCYRVLDYLLKTVDADRLSFINVHGTSTPYNDEMESIAISRAGLSEVPINALKGFYGHTMGAAGVLESIISMQAADAGLIIGTKGYESCGVSCHVNVSAENRQTDKQAFIKILSGFGGCNAGIVFTKGGLI